MAESKKGHNFVIRVRLFFVLMLYIKFRFLAQAVL